MPRANRFFLPGYIYHITHRCHDRTFLFKSKKVREVWVHWLREAKVRYGLVVLNYMVTSNHIHLLVQDTGDDVIAKSIHLIAGATAQNFNNVQERKGAFWEDRYHATAFQSNSHFLNCMAYIDLNMCRTGKIKHPDEWLTCAYREVRKPKERYQIIDHKNIVKLSGEKDLEGVCEIIDNLIHKALHAKSKIDQPDWTSSIAIGDDGFVKTFQKKLKLHGEKRVIEVTGNNVALKEPKATYGLLEEDNRMFYDSKVDFS
ncbi:MAG: transposase [Planctomycetota bacterium]|nr:MAG: transposase [Planctomycetota bacterium]